jgi:hypothetical protein
LHCQFYKIFVYLCTILVGLSSLPRVEVRHAHASGQAPHQHDNDALHDDYLASDEPRQASPHHRASRIVDGNDWHVHVAWAGGLLATTTLSIPTDPVSGYAIDVQSGVCGNLAAEPRPRISPTATLKNLHGPPIELLAPNRLASALHHFTIVDTSTRLCDAARHERSGVMLF